MHEFVYLAREILVFVEEMISCSGLGGFNLVIAGSNKIFFLMCPSSPGKILGRASLVAFLGHGQVVAGTKL